MGSKVENELDGVEVAEAPDPKTAKITELTAHCK